MTQNPESLGRLPYSGRIEQGSGPAVDEVGPSFSIVERVEATVPLTTLDDAARVVEDLGRAEKLVLLKPSKFASLARVDRDQVSDVVDWLAAKGRVAVTADGKRYQILPSAQTLNPRDQVQDIIEARTALRTWLEERLVATGQATGDEKRRAAENALERIALQITGTDFVSSEDVSKLVGPEGAELTLGWLVKGRLVTPSLVGDGSLYRVQKVKILSVYAPEQLSGTHRSVSPFQPINWFPL